MTTCGSNPAARHARTTMPSSDGAVHGSRARSVSTRRLRAASGCPSGRTATIGSSSMSMRRRPSGSRRGSVTSWKHRPACRSPRRTASATSACDPSCMATSRSGSAARSAASAAGASVAIALGNAPRRSSRRSCATTAPIWRSASSSRAASASACSSSRAPAGVGTVPPRPRTSSCVPSSRSRLPTCWETAGWLSASAAAACENEPSRATARNVSSRRGSSIRSAYRYAR